MTDLLYEQLEDERDEFNKITQEGCDYDKETVNIDLEENSEVCNSSHLAYFELNCNF